jgi:hypothetical protein
LRQALGNGASHREWAVHAADRNVNADGQEDPTQRLSPAPVNNRTGVGNSRGSIGGTRQTERWFMAG